ncbi:sulfurtransferase [Haloechinothrix sp. YIM 98757]|uniref:Sulfurtransferase n=1 Tax=Haloechinothrix aidingensis TaxID=2752311 RepID=A0A838A6Z1_9PSEU|nr:sulfurtransferase [Haloechinothrix aidingensis]MBA0125700.1 sulfurtransferase [Haloechinothrix aidingensis]
MGPLISTEKLAAMLEGPAPPVVLDVRWRLAGPPGAESYAEGHLPGAVFVDVDSELAAAPGEAGRHPLPEPAELERTLRAAGVTGDRAVVAYDDADGSVAARAWWLLRWAGHTEVAVLDGGYAAWVAEERPVTTTVPDPPEGDIEVRPGGMPVLDADEAARCARAGTLLDARVPERYGGYTEPVDPRAGHIPGAINAPFTAHTDARQRWRDPDDLARHFVGLGVRSDAPVGAYCGSGITASAAVLALEVAGFAQHAGLYTGSWSHWSRDPRRPAATGEEPG